jgi:NADPH:quinone reductase-like Zn-dependent oxidoreductase
VFALTPGFFNATQDGEAGRGCQQLRGVACTPCAAVPAVPTDTPCVPLAGCYAEYVACDEAWLARVPDNLPLEVAAGVPLVALTAWQALQGAAPQAGQRLVINAAAGGVGHVAVQLAKVLGLHVTALAGPANIEFVQSLGADVVRRRCEQHHAGAAQRRAGARA